MPMAATGTATASTTTMSPTSMGFITFITRSFDCSPNGASARAGQHQRSPSTACGVPAGAFVTSFTMWEDRRMAVQTLPVAELQRAMRGPVLDPEHGAYETGRASFNALIDRRPAVIARCACTEDVVAAV